MARTCILKKLEKIGEQFDVFHASMFFFLLLFSFVLEMNLVDAFEHIV